MRCGSGERSEGPPSSHLKGLKRTPRPVHHQLGVLTGAASHHTQIDGIGKLRRELEAHLVSGVLET